ncbi:MAG: hypothetical protein COB23_09450 [Methylophaga sp.]|nr:MAG: hypothetical protein COB23_09450 [Methylophaga sp.]
MSEQNYDEKRDFVRMSIETRVSYTIEGSGDNTHHGSSQNLSAKGLYMTTDFAPILGDIIDIVMNPSGDRLPPFVAEGKVVRCKPDKNDSTLFHVSIQFIQTN